MKFITKRMHIISVGFAMFSMFFGAGNVVFPLLLGKETAGHSPAALLGLVLTAVLVPFLGLFSVVLFEGDYRRYFSRLGRVPGFLIVLLIMGLIGPFGAVPRCVTLSYSTIQMFFPSVQLIPFCLVSMLVLFLFAYSKTKITDLIGCVLTPFLLLSLAIITIRGILDHPSSIEVIGLTAPHAFFKGVLSGYNTMDLLGAFFFCSVIIESLKSMSHRSLHSLYTNAKNASLLGAFLLGLVYIGLSLVASFHSSYLIGIPSDKVLGIATLKILGPWAGIVTCAAMALACLTTAIALVAVFADYIHYDIFRDKINYIYSLVITLIVTFFVSTLEFQGIVNFLIPIMEVLYPSLIVLVLCNILHELWGFRLVKLPVAITFVVSLFLTFIV